MATVGLALASLVGMGGVVRADEAQVQNVAPTISNISITDTQAAENAVSTLTPADGGSIEYSLRFDIVDPNTLADLDNITMCFYHSTEASPCAPANAATDVKLTWTEATNAITTEFGTEQSSWGDDPDTESASAQALAGTANAATSFTFKVHFKVPEIWRHTNAGEDMRIDITATDDSPTNSSETFTLNSGGEDVAYYSEFTSRTANTYLVTPHRTNRAVSNTIINNNKKLANDNAKIEYYVTDGTVDTATRWTAAGDGTDQVHRDSPPSGQDQIALRCKARPAAGAKSYIAGANTGYTATVPQGMSNYAPSESEDVTTPHDANRAESDCDVEIGPGVQDDNYTATAVETLVQI